MRERVPDHPVLLHGSLYLRKKSMEDQPDHLHADAVLHGYSVPGSYDPADLYLRWNFWNPEPQSDPDIHASGLLGIHGGIHVPWIFKGGVPISLEEAAQIDGAGKLRTFFQIVFPLLKPTTATLVILYALSLWNDYLLPSLILTDKSLYTIPIATKLFQGTYSNDMDLLMAALVMAIIPVIILYIALQKYIIAGVVAGAVKS